MKFYSKLQYKTDPPNVDPIVQTIKCNNCFSDNRISFIILYQKDNV